MDNVQLGYQKQYINLLAKLGEIDLIINMHKEKKEDLMKQAAKMGEALRLLKGSEEEEEASEE